MIQTGYWKMVSLERSDLKEAGLYSRTRGRCSVGRKMFRYHVQVYTIKIIVTFFLRRTKCGSRTVPRTLLENHRESVMGHLRNIIRGPTLLQNIFSSSANVFLGKVDSLMTFGRCPITDSLWFSNREFGDLEWQVWRHILPGFGTPKKNVTIYTSPVSRL